VKSEVIVTQNELPADVIRAIQGGRKIEAIKILREATGIGLANAKVLVDRAALSYGPKKKSPAAFSEESVLPKLAKSVFFGLVLVGFYFYYVKV